jgi:hypothetical protein
MLNKLQIMNILLKIFSVIITAQTLGCAENPTNNNQSSSITSLNCRKIEQNDQWITIADQPNRLLKYLAQRSA